MNVVAPDAWPLATDAVGAGALQPPGPTTIGALLRVGRGLTATCAVCLHSARLDLVDLVRRLGADHPCAEAALRPRLQCSVCQSCEAVLQAAAPRGGARGVRARSVTVVEV